MRDPYGVLGISRDATLDEIKRAFRGRAKELHPDANPGDDGAAERFKDASAAYEILTDPEKRAHYMRGDWDPWRDGEWGGAHGRSDDIVFDKEFGPGDREADLFGDIAGNRRGRGGTSMIIQGDDMAEDLRVDFIEVPPRPRRLPAMSPNRSAARSPGPNSLSNTMSSERPPAPPQSPSRHGSQSPRM